MKYCSSCQKHSMIQISSLHTRLLVSIYMVMTLYFFMGDMEPVVLIALIPFIIPYKYKCTDCNALGFGLPQATLKTFWAGNTLDVYLLAMLPSILTIGLLIVNFPNTGLERIGYLPTNYLINSMVILLYIFKFKKRNGLFNFISWLLLIFVTVILSVVTYPQEYGDGIIKRIFS